MRLEFKSSEDLEKHDESQFRMFVWDLLIVSAATLIGVPTYWLRGIHAGDPNLLSNAVFLSVAAGFTALGAALGRLDYSSGTGEIVKP